jgi:hypothetical protein
MEGRNDKMLTLPIKKKWFDMILSGEKKEEYREIKPYYTSRFENELEIDRFMYGEDYLHIILRNGHSKSSPYMKVKCILRDGYGKEEWGAEPNKVYYVLKIVEILEVGNVKKC